MRLIYRVVTAVSAVALIGGVVVAPASVEAATTTYGYRYWSYWTGSGANWKYASVGPSDRVPADRGVDGWRFVISASPVPSALPRKSAAYDTLCPKAATPPSGKKRVAIVIDSGVQTDAPTGETPPALKVLCLVVGSTEDSATILSAAATVRSKDGLVCGINGYPKTECAPRVPIPTPTPTPKPTPTKPKKPRMPKVPKSLKHGKKKSLPAKTNLGQKLTYKSRTPKKCTVSGRKLKAKKKGTCTLQVTARKTKTATALSKRYKIRIK